MVYTYTVGGYDPAGNLLSYTDSVMGTQWAHTNVWGAGQLLATYSADPDPTQNVAGILNFYIDDPLGTRRVMTDYAGNTAETCHSLPYGNGEDCAATPAEHLFTQHDRDAETGNDYFGARYYASSMGRFLTPDWSAKIEPVPYSKLDDPQSLNLYAYVGNNPFIRLDADGHDCSMSSGGSTFANNAGCTVSVDKTNQTAMLTQTHSTTVLKDADGNVTTDNQKAVTSVTTTTTTSVTISTAARSNGQVLGGESIKTTSTVDLQNPRGAVQESKAIENLNPLQAIQAAGADKVSALQNLEAPSTMDRVMDHKIGIGGALGGGAIAVGCVIAEPCGAAVAITGIAIGVASTIYDAATH